MAKVAGYRKLSYLPSCATIRHSSLGLHDVMLQRRSYTGWSCCDCSKTGNHDNQTSRHNKKLSGRTQNAAGAPKYTETWILSSCSPMNYSKFVLVEPFVEKYPIFERAIKFLSNFQNLGYHQLGNPQDFDFDHIK